MATDGSSVEVRQMERETAKGVASSYQPDRPLTRSELSSLASPDWITIARSPEAVFGAVDRSPQKEKFRSALEVKGAILAPNNEFTQLVKGVSEKLGVPDQTEVVLLDTEDVDAFFHPGSKTIVFTRGFGRYFLDHGLSLSEDHIAAVLAHELEHAHVIGDDYLEKVKSNYFERIKTMQNHAEEYRADAEAMRRLSKAGYNPQAIIEILRAFPLTEGRASLSHPELIDRVRKLEDRLADDEHPLSHTQKPQQTISQNLIEWFKAESRVYALTDQVLSQHPDATREMLSTIDNQDLFWDTYTLLQHVEHVGKAKGLLESNDEVYTKLATKVILVNAIMQRHLVVGGKEIDNQILERASIREWNNQEQQAEDDTLTFMRDWVNYVRGTTEKLDVAVSSYSFRDSVPQLPLTGVLAQNNLDMINTFDQALDKICQAALATQGNPSASPEEADFLNQLYICYTNNTLTEDIMRTAFYKVDQDHLLKQSEEYREKLRAQGMREPEVLTGLSVDFSDLSKRQQLFDQIRLSIAVEYIKLPYSAGEQTLTHLGRLIHQSTGIPLDLAQTIGASLLKANEADPLSQSYLMREAYSKEQLIEVLRSLKDVSVGHTIRLSPLRGMHTSLRDSIMAEDVSTPDELFQKRAEVKRFLEAMIALQAYAKAGGEKISETQSTRDLFVGIENVNLTLEEWNLIKDIDPEFGNLRAVWLVKQYLRALDTGKPLDADLQKAVADIENWPSHQVFRLKISEINKLLEKPPWNPRRLLEIIEPSLSTQHEEQLTEKEQLIELQANLKAYHVFGLVEGLEARGLGGGQYETSRRILHLLLKEKLTNNDIPFNNLFMGAVRTMVDNNIALTRENVLTLHMRIDDWFNTLTQEDINQILSYLNKDPQTQKTQNDFYESLLLYSQLPLEQRPSYVKRFMLHTDVMVDALLNKYQDKALEWILTNLTPSIRRDELLVNLYNQSQGPLKEMLGPLVEQNLSFSPDQREKREGYDRRVFFDYSRYSIDKRGREDTQPFRGLGRLATDFDDILVRRHAYITLAGRGRGSLKTLGNIRQQFQSERLYAIENTIFNQQLPLEERLNQLSNAAHHPSAVRDIYLEMVLKDELVLATAPDKRIEVFNTLLPLFTPDSSLLNQYATERFTLELNVNPALLQNADNFLGRLQHFMPKPSLARNHFLNIIENAVALTPDQLRHISNLRVTTEGKTEDSDTAPWTFVVNKLGEINRLEKTKAVLWLLGLSTEKPIAIRKMEDEYDGHLDSLPKAVMASLPEERTTLYQRFFLGAEGILDVESLSGEARQQAEQQRKAFLDSLASTLFPHNGKESDLFREIFVTILETSEPAHGTQILSKIMNEMIDTGKKGQVLKPEETVAIGLSELGVVGKKVSQSLAELDWVPDSYKKTLRRAQSEGEVVPRRALLILAEDSGLLDENSPIRIISFDGLAGAASNKQAAFLTVDVNDESVGLPKGSHKVVGKFKRPSAQKTENITHDLRVLRGILDVLNRRGYAEALPRDFSAQINNAIRRELDFSQEKLFSGAIRADLNERNTRRRMKVSIPNIYYASDDVMMESVASGISLRAYKDLREAGVERLLASGYGALSERDINQTIITEGLAQLITTGNIHADLHPGNIFLDQQGNLTLIDLGMNEKLNAEQRLNTISLMAGLEMGNEVYVKRTLKNLGWDLGGTRLDLSRFNFAQNTVQMLRVSQKASVPPPQEIASIILATSKLTAYTEGFSNAELFRMLIGTVNRREAPRIIAHLIQSGGRDLLR